MSSLQGSPSQRRHSSTPDRHGHTHDRVRSYDLSLGGVFTYPSAADAAANSIAADPPTPFQPPKEPPEPLVRSRMHALYNSYDAFTSTSTSRPLAEVAADPEGRFVWALSSSSSRQQQLFRAGGLPATKLAGAKGPTGRWDGGGSTTTF